MIQELTLIWAYQFENIFNFIVSCIDDCKNYQQRTYWISHPGREINILLSFPYAWCATNQSNQCVENIVNDNEDQWNGEEDRATSIGIQNTYFTLNMWAYDGIHRLWNVYATRPKTNKCGMQGVVFPIKFQRANGFRFVWPVDYVTQYHR